MIHLESFRNLFKKNKSKYIKPEVYKIKDRFIEIEDQGFIIKSGHLSEGKDNFGYLEIMILPPIPETGHNMYGVNMDIIRLEKEVLDKIINEIETIYGVKSLYEPITLSCRTPQSLILGNPHWSYFKYPDSVTFNDLRTSIIGIFIAFSANDKKYLKYQGNSFPITLFKK